MSPARQSLVDLLTSCISRSSSRVSCRGAMAGVCLCVCVTVQRENETLDELGGKEGGGV